MPSWDSSEFLALIVIKLLVSIRWLASFERISPEDLFMSLVVRLFFRSLLVLRIFPERVLRIGEAKMWAWGSESEETAVGVGCSFFFETAKFSKILF